MDLQFSALLSLGEVVVWSRLQGTLQVERLVTLGLLSRFLACFFLQYAALKFYRVVIYPHFVSPLRHLPGPKVGLTSVSFK